MSDFTRAVWLRRRSTPASLWQSKVGGKKGRPVKPRGFPNSDKQADRNEFLWRLIHSEPFVAIKPERRALYLNRGTRLKAEEWRRTQMVEAA